MASTLVSRVTCFKIPKEADCAAMVAAYKVLANAAVKDGKPYILCLEAGSAYPSDASQGYTFVARSAFKDMDDYEYYDSVCPAHKALKATIKEKNIDIQGMTTVFYTPAVSHRL